MIVFHGGFSKNQINQLKNNKYIIYKKGNLDNFRINWSNTFKYYSIDSYNKKQQLFQNIIDQNYFNQWIHCFKYLHNAMDFCDGYYNYIMAFELDNVDQYIGVGKYKYEGYKVEYRIPRNRINNTNIIDIIKYDSYDKDQLEKLKNKYKDNFYELREHEEAVKILKKIKQKCNYI